MKQGLSFLALLLASAITLHAQIANSFTLERTLQWAAQSESFVTSDGTEIALWSFEGMSRTDAYPTLPTFTERFELAGPSNVEVVVESVQWEPFVKAPHPDDAALDAQGLVVKTFIDQERERWFGRVSLIPVRQTATGVYERAVAFTLRVNTRTMPPAVIDRTGPFTFTSALSDGDIYKFGVASSAVYKLDYSYLKNDLGITNLSSIDPRSIRLYGNGGLMLPERNSDARADDLIENAIFVSGESDGKFDESDYILFYATGPAPWQFREHATLPKLTIRQNLYDTHAWYFIKIGGVGQGLRIAEQASIPADENAVSTSFDDVQRIEDEKFNLLDQSDSHQGSGKRWFGDLYDQTRTRSYSMTFPNTLTNTSGRVRMEFAGRCNSSSIAKLNIDNVNFSASIAGVAVGNNNAATAAVSGLGGTFTPNDDLIDLFVNYAETAQPSEGWLDFIEVNVRRRLVMSGKMMEFRDLNSMSNQATLFRLDGAGGGINIWDVTDRQTPRRQQFTLNGATAQFGANTDSTLRNYIAFFDDASFPKPEAKVGKIGNQNIHGIDNVHMAIVYEQTFEAQAQQLAQHRRDFSQLDVALVRVDQLFNEFSSGGKDPVAIRDFARMLYERNTNKFNFLLLLGDGSFDPKNNSKGQNNFDFIPVYETDESFNPIQAHPSDDFFALLSPNEDGSLTGALDIAVGRIPCNTANEAQIAVDKIITYDTKPVSLGDWHLRLLYTADDEDNNVHVAQADKLARESQQTEDWFNLEKVYFDAYQQISTSSEKRIPDAKSAINANMFKGALVVNYVGHGGPRGWAQERVIDNSDIAGWENGDRLPFIVTATCSFGGFDDYSFLTGGEQAMLKPSGGSVGMFTTVRSVYIGANEALTDAIQLYIFRRLNDNSYLRVGDILKLGKNAISSGDQDNARRFALLGDPAMHLAMPEYRVRTTTINGLPLAQADTIGALQNVTLEGEVTDIDGNWLSGFNGRVFVTLFDKEKTLRTLGQDPESQIFTYQLQNNALFRGSATVTGGRFSLNFVTPKDINYAFGQGKISYYAENGTPLDAAGSDRNVVIGGTSNEVSDDQPPVVGVFLNTDDFVTGGITDNDPKILIKCSDDHGMNVSGAGLGHDLTAVLDGNVLETLILNDFYQSEQDNPRKGQAIYPLRNLSVGRHTLKVKGWDVANNSGEGYTEFVVAEDGKAALDHVLNYPNPFTTNTLFQFEHNLAGQTVDVQISVFTVGGKLVKTIQHTADAAGYRVTDIAWDGKDDYGDQLARGVYVYRIKLRGTDVSGNQVTAQSDYEKLVILK